MMFFIILDVGTRQINLKLKLNSLCVLKYAMSIFTDGKCELNSLKPLIETHIIYITNNFKGFVKDEFFLFDVQIDFQKIYHKSWPLSRI